MHSNKEGNFEKVKVILLDVAGTTTSLEFIKEKLFTFIKDEAATYLKKNFENEAVKKALEGIKENDKELDVETAVEQIKKLTNENSENASLKTLQGLISKEGYERGSLKAHIYEDVRAAFETWSVNKKIAIYSTGDKESQKLLFEHTDQGNLTSHISNYFDQSIGTKTEPESYTKILEELKVSADEVLFVNDNSKELCAAKKSGLLTALIKREGNAHVEEEAKEISTTISSFSELLFEATNKRKIEETTDVTEIPPSKVPKTIETKEPEAKVGETGKAPEITNSKDTEETSSEVEAMDVDSSEKTTVTEKSAEAESKDSMETEEVKSEEVPTTDPEKTEVDETPAKVEETKNKVDNAVEEKSIETETKTEESAEVGSSSNDKDEVAMEDDAKEKESVEVTAKEGKETETKEVETESKVDVSVETTEIDNAEVTTTNTIDEQQCSNEKPADVATKESNHVQSDNKEELNKVTEEVSSDKKEEVVESKTSDSVEEKPLISEEKVEETSTDGTNKSSAEDKNGISENGNTNEETTEATKSNEDVSNGVANGQENGDKSTDAKENEDETEIKVKKIETNEGSPAVAVEV